MKELEFKNTGVILEYWRINFVGTDIEENTTRVRVGGYIVKADALEGKKAVDNIHYTFAGAENPITLATDPADYQDLLYDKIIAVGTAFTNNKLVGGELVSDMP